MRSDDSAETRICLLRRVIFRSRVLRVLYNIMKDTYIFTSPRGTEPEQKLTAVELMAGRKIYIYAWYVDSKQIRR